MFRSPLVQADVALRHRLGLLGLDAAEEGVDGKVPPLDAVIEIGENRKIALVSGERLQQVWKIKVPPFLLREEFLRIHAEGIAHADHFHPFAGSPLHCRCTKKVAE